MSFFNPGVVDNSRRNNTSDADMSAMDDVQFSASLDALLNGDQNAMGGGGGTTQQNNSSRQGLSPPLGASGGGGGGGMPQQQNGGFMVGAPGASLLNNHSHQQNHHHQQQQPHQQQRQQQRQQQLHGLPLASSNQGPLHLTPQGAHSAAQMSLSAGHAAATGAFHPGNTNHMAQGLPPPQMPSQQQQQNTFSWPVTSTNLANLPQQHHQHQMSNACTSSSSGVSAITAPSGLSCSHGGSVTHHSSPTDSMSRGASKTSSAGGNNNNVTTGTKRRRDSGANANPGVSVSAVSEDEGDHEKRRQDRNMREQQRSHRITEQISHLKEMLSAANLQFKPDKYSTLSTTVDYIKQLQEKSKMLDTEHKKLLDTITKTNDAVNNQYIPAYTSGSDTPSVSNDLLADGPTSSSPSTTGTTQLEDEAVVFVRGIDYKVAFKGCGIPMALTSIDGRFLDCNNTFLELTGCPREQLLPLELPGTETNVSFSPAQNEDQKKNLSLFNLLSRDGMEEVFVAMSEMLKQPGSVGSTKKRSESSRLADFWSGPVKLSGQRDLPVKLNVTLVRTNRGRPKFFNCALTALGEEDMRYDDQTTITTPSQDQSASDTTTASVLDNQALPPLPPPEPVSSNAKKPLLESEEKAQETK